MSEKVLVLIVLLFLYVGTKATSAQDDLVSLADLKLETPKEEESRKVVPLPTQADAFRKEFALKLRKGQAVRKDYDTCKKGIETLELPEHKQYFYLQLAEYHRIIDRNSVKALEVLAPLVIDKVDAEQWIADQREATQNAIGAWSKDFNDAKAKSKNKKYLPERPEGLFVEFPAMETWRLDDDTAFVCIEIVRNLVMLNRHREAFRIIDTIAENCDIEFRVLVAECAADLMVWVKMYDKAIQFYGYANNLIRQVAVEVKKLEKTTFIVETCNYKLSAEDLIEYLKAIEEQAKAVGNSIGQQDSAWCAQDSGVINTTLGQITDPLIN